MKSPITTLPRISHSKLSTIILTKSPSINPAVAIIDVRDDDHVGGQIVGSTHVPSHTLDHKLPQLVRSLQNKDTVIFHCTLSQHRGPDAALRYLRERERLLGSTGKTTTGEATAKSMQEDKEAEAGNEAKGEADRKGDLSEKEWEDVGPAGKNEQKVYVLERGFVGWQEVYGEDERLTEGYKKDIWKDRY